MAQTDSTLARDLPDALRMLARAELDGVLHVTGAGNEAQLVIARGKIVLAARSDTVAGGCVVTPDTLRGALRIQAGRRDRRPIGTILYDLGLLNARMTDEELASHIAGVLQETLSWKDGTFRFEAQEIPTNGAFVSPALSVSRILLKVPLPDA